MTHTNMKYGMTRGFVVAALVSLLCVPMVAQRASVVIGPGDTVHVQVFDTPEMDQKVQVDDNGNAPLMFVGSVAVGGKTPQQAAQIVQGALLGKKLMQHPQVAVTLESSATLDVAVGGEVNHPGAYALTTPRPVLDVLDMAGGLTAMANRHILIEHRGEGGGTESYFVSNQGLGGTEMKVRPGDRIIVPKAGIVYVMGDVGHPGGYTLNGNDAAVTLLQALSLAESPNKTALYKHIQLLRRSGDKYVLVPVNVNDVKAGKADDPVLQANDVVLVPFSYVKNFAINSTAVLNTLGSAAIYAH